MNTNEPKLIIMSGEYKSSVITFNPHEEIILGRDPKVSTLVFSSPHISRKHCSIQYNPNTQRFKLINMSSTGITVNGVRQMRQNEYDNFKSGDVITLGKTDNVFKLYAPTMQDGHDNDNTDMLPSNNGSEASYEENSDYAGILINSHNGGSKGKNVNESDNGSNEGKQSSPLCMAGLIVGITVCLISIIMWIVALGGDDIIRTCYNMYDGYAVLIYLLMVCGFVGAILSIIGLVSEGKSGRVKGVIGIILSLICIILLFLIIFYAGQYTPEQQIEDQINDFIDSWF